MLRKEFSKEFFMQIVYTTILKTALSVSKGN